MIDNGILRAEGTPPLFMPTNTAGYLVADGQTSLEAFVLSRPAIAVIKSFAQWLRSSGIDLILAPAPKMVEVYPERTVKETPRDRLVAPQMRRFLLDLTDADIEIVDLLPAFLELANKPGDPLYLPADTHWSDRAQQVAANMIGERLKRYPFVRQALARPPLYGSTNIRVDFKGYIYAYLNAREREEVRDATSTRVTVVAAHNGSPFAETDDAPVLVIGDSFTHYFRYEVHKGSGIDALLGKAINQPVSNVSIASATTQPLKDLVRSPELLRKTRVVVWIITNDLLAHGQNWDSIPFPARQTR
jgi:hypothetical protein